MTFKGHPRSSEMSQFDTAHVISYYMLALRSLDLSESVFKTRLFLTVRRHWDVCMILALRKYPDLLTYLPFHNNYGPILCRFPHIASHWSKSRNLRTPPIYNAPVGWRKYDDMLSCFDTIPERDRRTDGQTEFLYQCRASALQYWRAIKIHTLTMVRRLT